MDSISEKHVRDSRIQGTIIAILCAGTLASAIIAIGLGSSSTLDPISTIKIILGLEEGSDLQTVIIWELRFPRVLMAIIGGAALGTAGVLMQGCLGSPLVSPLTLGVASGSALGAAFSIILGFSVISEVSVVAIAFLFSLAVVAIITKLGNMRSVSSESYILVGIAITFISGAIVSTFTFFATGAQLSQLANWSYGSLSRPSLTEVIWVSAAIICLMPSAMKWAWDLNTLSLGGDDFAISSGVNPSSTRRNILILSALMTSLVIAFTGLIGFVGLAAPHMGRLVIGNDYRKLIPCSAVLGSLLMLFADTAGRTLFTPVIIPVGMIMAIIGGPLFVYLLLQNREVAI